MSQPYSICFPPRGDTDDPVQQRQLRGPPEALHAQGQRVRASLHRRVPAHRSRRRPEVCLDELRGLRGPRGRRDLEERGVERLQLPRGLPHRLPDIAGLRALLGGLHDGHADARALVQRVQLAHRLLQGFLGAPARRGALPGHPDPPLQHAPRGQPRGGRGRQPRRAPRGQRRGLQVRAHRRAGHRRRQPDHHEGRDAQGRAHLPVDPGPRRREPEERRA
mmetsp:Transcript_27758/g.61277  ORF Transcript_27758/g.61277 Transcript_27758/m.61277 type:complete len:220 (+) Transcript_27758:3-662(+)